MISKAIPELRRGWHIPTKRHTNEFSVSEKRSLKGLIKTAVRNGEFLFIEIRQTFGSVVETISSVVSALIL